MKVDFEVEGLAELEKQLLALGAETGFKTLRTAGRKAMAPVLASAQAGAWVDSGDMKDSLALRARRGKNSKQRVVDIEVGSFRRVITETDEEGNKTKRKISRQDMKVAAQEYGVRGIAASPFLRPALEKNAQTVLGLLQTELSKAIQRAVKRAAKK